MLDFFDTKPDVSNSKYITSGSACCRHENQILSFFQFYRLKIIQIFLNFIPTSKLNMSN